MPRDGSGTADNATGEPGHNIIHGTGKEVRFAHSILSYPIPSQLLTRLQGAQGAKTKKYNSIEINKTTNIQTTNILNKQPTTDHVARADKTAPLPEPEKGAAIEGLSASGGGDKYTAQGGDLSESGVEGKQ